MLSFQVGRLLLEVQQPEQPEQPERLLKIPPKDPVNVAPLRRGEEILGEKIRVGHKKKP